MKKRPRKKHDLRTIAKKILYLFMPSKDFSDSASYWEDRYKRGGGSGRGSYHELAKFKAKTINSFIAEHDISDIIEHGFGDGNQLKYMKYKSYKGFDVSPEAVAICRRKFRNDDSKFFGTNDDYRGDMAELSISLDVIYHLVEDRVFKSYIQRLFSSSNSYVIIYSTNFNDPPAKRQGHVRNREFTNYVIESFPTWELVEMIPNEFPPSPDGKDGSPADFYIYKKKDSTG